MPKFFTGRSAEFLMREAVAIRGNKTRCGGAMLPKVIESCVSECRALDLWGQEAWGFSRGSSISHSHSIDGRLGLFRPCQRVESDSLEELGPFVEDVEEVGQGNGAANILEIQGMPLAFWSHLDALNAEFRHGGLRESSNCIACGGMDGHTSWANRSPAPVAAGGGSR